MKFSTWSWWLPTAAGAILLLFLPGSALGQPGKGKAQDGNVIQVDLNRLPPALAQQLLSVAEDNPKKGPGQGKGQAAQAPSKGKAAAGKGKAAAAPSKGKAAAAPSKGKAPGKGPGKGDAGKKGKPMASAAYKGKGAAAPGKGGKSLPPGLANKPKDHPGVVNFLAHAGGKGGPGAAPKGPPAKSKAAAAPSKGKAPAPAGKYQAPAPKGPPAKGGPPGKGSDLESRLDNLINELEALRREVRGRR